MYDSENVDFFPLWSTAQQSGLLTYYALIHSGDTNHLLLSRGSL